MELVTSLLAVIFFLVYAVAVIAWLFKPESDDATDKDKRFYFRQYLYHKKKAAKAYKKYLSLKRDGGDNIKSRRR